MIAPGNTLILALCNGSLARINALSLKGPKTRANALLHYWIGAAEALRASGDVERAELVGLVAYTLIATQGEKGITGILAYVPE